MQKCGVKAQDLAVLEGAHFRMLRRMMNLDSDDTHLPRENLLDAFSMPPIKDILAQKRMRWLGHALRRPDQDRSRIAVLETLADPCSAWTKMIRKDCLKFGIPFGSLLKIALDRSSFRRLTHVRTGDPT